MLQRSSDLLSTKAKKTPVLWSGAQSPLLWIGGMGPMLSAGQTKELCILQHKCVRLIDRTVPISEAFKKVTDT